MTTSYTIAGVFRPDLGASADGLTVEAFPVASWSGTNNPPHLGDTPPGWPTLVNPNTTTSTNYGNHGSWELPLPTNEDYFVVVEYSSSFYWERYNAPAWLDGTSGELDATTVSATNVNIFGTAAGGLDTANADVQTLGTTNTASASGGTLGLAAFADHIHKGLGQSLELSGANQPTRYVGATTSGSGAPTSGTFTAGDFVIDPSGAIYICTTAGSPGTWVGLLPPGNEGAPGDIKAFAGIAVPTGWLACDGTAYSRATYANLCAALSTSQFTGSNAFTGNTTNANASVTGVPTAVWNALQVGWPISGTNIQSGTTIAGLPSSGQITLSVNASGTGTGVSLFAAPWGIGNGTTTFNVPDLRGRTFQGSTLLGTTFTFSGNTHSSTLIDGISATSMARLYVGAGVAGSGVIAGSTIAKVLSSSSIQLSVATSSSVSGNTISLLTPIGAYGGEGGVIFADTNQIPSHYHTLTDAATHTHGINDPTHYHLFSHGGAQWASGGAWFDHTFGYNPGNSAYATSGNYTGISLVGSGVAADLAMAAVGGTEAHDNMSPFAAGMYVIKS